MASAAACIFLLQFLQSGLRDAHPARLRQARSQPRRPGAAAEPDQLSLFRTLRGCWDQEAALHDRAVSIACERADASSWALRREAQRVKALCDGTLEAPPSLELWLAGCRRLQIALDVPDLDTACAIAAEAAANGADFLEVGDPLIKRYGLAAVEAVHEVVPDAKVVVEIVSADWSGEQVEMAGAAGADAILLLGCRTPASASHAATTAARLRLPLVVDVAPDMARASWIRTLARSDIQGIAAIGNLDSASTGMTSLDRAHTLRRTARLPVAVSGGFRRDDLPTLARADWDILIVGQGVVGQPDPGAETAALAARIHELPELSLARQIAARTDKGPKQATVQASTMLHPTAHVDAPRTDLSNRRRHVCRVQTAREEHRHRAFVDDPPRKVPIVCAPRRSERLRMGGGGIEKHVVRHASQGPHGLNGRRAGDIGHWHDRAGRQRAFDRPHRPGIIEPGKLDDIWSNSADLIDDRGGVRQTRNEDGVGAMADVADELRHVIRPVRRGSRQAAHRVAKTQSQPPRRALQRSVYFILRLDAADLDPGLSHIPAFVKDSLIPARSSVRSDRNLRP